MDPLIINETWTSASDEDLLNLISDCADVNIANPSGETPLILAVKYQKKQAVEALIAKAANLESAPASGSTALNEAAMLGDYEIAKILIDNGANVDAISSIDGFPSYTILHHAARLCNEAIVFLLLDKVSNFNQLDGNGKTPADVAKDAGFDIIDVVIEDYALSVLGE